MMARLTISVISPMQLRWLVLLAFPFAYFMSGAESASYFAWGFLACAWLIYRIDSFRADTIPIWMVLFIFICFYYLRYPLLVNNPEVFASISPHSVEVLFIYGGRSGLDDALRHSNILFFTFCLVVGVLYGKKSRIKIESINPRKNEGNKISYRIIVALFVLIIALGYIAYNYRIGQMGVPPGEPLPFRLKGVVFYARQVLVPLLILALINQATRSDNRYALGIGWMLLAIHGVSDTLLRGSRSSILLCALLVVFMYASGGVKIRRKELIVLFGAVGGAILLFPTITYFRILQFQAGPGYLENLVYAFNHVNQDIGGLLKSSLYSIYSRLPGIETVWSVNSLMDNHLGSRLIEVIRSPFGLTGFLNFEIYQVPVEANTLFAPGFVGWFYLAGGCAGLIIGGVTLAILCVWVPRWIYGGKLLWAPLVNTFFLWILFISLTDGTLDSNFLLIAAGLATLTALEFFGRAARPSTRG